MCGPRTRNPRTARWTMRRIRQRKHWTAPTNNCARRWRRMCWTGSGRRRPRFSNGWWWTCLIAMGYGRGDAAMGRVTGCSGDGGIDGTIREDQLGLDEVYLQAKKYAADKTVGEGDLRNFAGAIDAAGTTKGVFVTTAGFTSAAKDYVARSPKRIVLIDGEALARLMVKHNIGVRCKMRYEVKRIDEDYFCLEDP